MNNETISPHQVGVISGLLLFTLKMTSLPSLIYKYNGIGAILSFITVIALNVLFLMLVVWFKQKYPSITLYDLLKNKLGVVVAKILYFLFFSLFFFKLLLMISDGFTFIKDVADDEFTIFNIFVCFLPIISALAYSGIRNIGRTCEFFVPFIVICLILAISFSIVPPREIALGSLVSRGFEGFFNSIFRLSFWTGDLFAIVIFLDKLEIKKGKLSQLFIPFGLLTTLLIIIYMLYFTLYQETSVIHVNLINDVVQYAIGTSKGWHMDFFAIIVFMINMFLQGSILLYCANECVKKIFNYNYSVISLSAINLLLVGAEFLYLTDYLSYIEFAENRLCYFSTITIILVPLIILILTLSKRKNKDETN